MGAFFKSFWGQLGRNTGKRVSNALYGDKWATPYRVAVDKTKSKSRNRNQYRGSSSSKQSLPSDIGSSANRGSSRSRNRRWLPWIAGFILFTGTYNAIINPNKEDVVLIIMLWLAAILLFSYKYLSPRR